MVSPEQPPIEPRRSHPVPPPARRRPLGFMAGLGVGLFLWLIIGLSTANIALGILFGLIPGLAIGIGLQITAQR